MIDQKRNPRFYRGVPFLSKYLVGFLLEAVEGFLAACYTDQQGMPVVQREHANKAFSVYLLFFVSYQHLKGLHHGKVHKRLNLPEGPNADIELSHQNPSNTVQMTIYAL